MEVIYLDHTSKLKDIEPHVMAIGFFDGVHLGHQELFERAKKHAKANGILCSALTFSPHPDEVIKGEKNRKYITPLQEKITKIAQCGIDRLFVMKFDKKFASLPPKDFIHTYITGINTNHVVVGFDFAFGCKAQGNTDLLKKMSQKGDFGVTVIPKKTFLNTKIGSTETKRLVYDGNVDLVPHFLGEYYEVHARVKKKFDEENVFNVEIHHQYILPKQGTYEVSILIDHGTYYGEITIQPNVENELRIDEYENPNDQALKIAFLNRLAVKSAVLV
ncbi:adenylyltransferase/cytidyltransferase family protein [Pseudogracilibacillus auburnensis]|uniref:Riboflavin biosynthesis protein n=1 Tax=Pseudogracilibacillus auburnensis TaxID=1494959 RepID=A0A2V3W4R6_9BACI|nr:FAD synthetase family protein [Pseudogracilibacillus auburnensis]PXW83749.1 riboflavin kinase/FMN adenylyltransferase [Pseudogracilibacillus auburnensis]